MLSSETLRLLAFEILRAKCDLKNSDIEEIFKTYYDIWMKLRDCNKELKSEDAIKFLK